MAVVLEIRDGSPHWYLSPDIFVVDSLSNPVEILPIAGKACYVMARVRNNGSTGAHGVYVRFYWSNPAVGVNRNTATLIENCIIDLNPFETKDVLCLTPLVPVYVNNGNECLVVEAVHDLDQPEGLGPDFKAQTVKQVAQKNLSVIKAVKAKFHFDFEVHSIDRVERVFEIVVRQVSMREGQKVFPKKLGELKQGNLIKISFNHERITPVETVKGQKEYSANVKVKGSGKIPQSITGTIEGGAVFMVVEQKEKGIVKGGLAILVLNG